MTQIATILIVIGMVVALATAQHDRDIAVTQANGPSVAAARGRRRNRGGAAVASRKSGRQPVVPSEPLVLGGTITDIRPAAERGQNVFATAFSGLSATAVVIDRTAVVFSSAGTPDYDVLVGVLAGRPQTARVRGYAKPARQSMYDTYGVDTVIEDPDNALFENVDTSGQHVDGINVLMLDDRTLTETHRLMEVPTTGYCVRCHDRVYRTDLVRVYVDRYGDGMWDESDLYQSSGPYANATRGTCTRCGLDRVVRFGTDETEMVRVIDHAHGYVLPRPRVERPRAETPVGAVPNPQAHCVVCRERVVRSDVKVTTFRNGRPATVGTCPHCDTTVWRAGGPQLAEVIHLRDTSRDYRFPLCGVADFRLLAEDEMDALSIELLESYDPRQFTTRCSTCESRLERIEMDELLAEESMAATEVATPICPDDLRFQENRPVPSHRPDDYYRITSERPDGLRFEFTAYSRGREKGYTCY